MKTTVHLTVVAIGLAIFTLSTSIAEAEDYRYGASNGTITTRECTCPGGDMSIPGEINGLPVKRIGEAAIFEGTSLTSVTIPDSVTIIGYGAFNDRRSLRSVSITAPVQPIAGNSGLSLRTKLPVSFDHRKRRFHEVHSQELHLYADKDGIDGAYS